MNKMSGDLRAMVLQALDNAGGVDYLTKQANQENPAAFLSLVAKCLPKDVNVAANVGIGDVVREAFERLRRPAVAVRYVFTG